MKQHTIYQTLAILAIALFMSSCANLKPFTQGLYDEYEWSERELKRIQYYLSEDIILRRQVSKGSKEIISGEIKIIDGKKVEEVRIPKGTPGVLLFLPKENRFAIGFEDGSDKYLVFGPETELGGRYTLKAKDWKRNSGTVTYDGKTYYTASEAAFASLMVDLRKIKDVTVKSRTAKGRKVK